MAEAFDFADWLRRAKTLYTLRDLALLTPPGVLGVMAKYLFAPSRTKPAEDVDAWDPEVVALWSELFAAMGESYFRWKVRGVENLPTQGPALLVGNHNGGIVVTDSLLTLAAVHGRFGAARRLYSLSHDVLHSTARLRSHVARAGVLRAGHRGGAKALRAGHMVLVYPGSDLDSTRTFADRYKIELGGRKGFLALAIREGVPIVPVVGVGTHEQFIVLSRGDRIAKALNTKRWIRVSTFPIVLALPWGLTSGYLPYFPLPAQTTIAFGKPLSWPSLTPADADDPAVLQRCYDDVREAMQRELDALAKGRVPFVG